MNQDNNENQNPATPTTGINQQFFKEVIEASGIPKERIKEKLGDLDTEWKNDTVQPVKTATDQEKIVVYDQLEIKDLPSDWKFQLARLKESDRKLVDYELKKDELKGWTDTFTEQSPEQLQTEINQLTEELTKTKEELTSWKEKHSSVESELNNWQQVFPQQTAQQVQQKIEEREKSLSEWIQAFGNRELKAVEEEWELLQQRPDISITEQQFWDDYAARKTIEQNKLDSAELEKQKELVSKFQEKSRKLRLIINDYLKLVRTRRQALAKPVLTIKQANEAIAELLEETEKSWDDYFEDNDENIADKNFELGLSLWEKDKETQARKVLEWIKEARATFDYQTLFERWNGSNEYKEEWDFDGGLYLLSKWLKVKNFEPVLEEKNNENQSD